MKLTPLDELVYYLSLLPGIGEKSALKIALFIKNNKNFTIKKFIKVLETFNNDIHICKECGFFSYKSDICEICSNTNRNRKIILVLSNIDDAIIFEKLNIYNGLYHILGGVISPLQGITPDELTISKLLERINILKPEEIIIGLPKNSYGEITTYFIIDKIKSKHSEIKISTLARGISSGFELNQLNYSTLVSSFKDRKTI